MKRGIYIGLGIFFVGLGLLGAFLPLLPTTPFLLLSLWLFARSSDKWKHWLLTNRLCGSYISGYYNGNGIPPRVKAYTLILLWATIACSAMLATELWWARCILLAVAVGVTIHILKFKTDKMKYRHITILAPTEAEAEPLRRQFAEKCGHEILVSGVGMAETAAAVCSLLVDPRPRRLVILAGIAGAYPDSGLTAGDCVVVDRESVADLGAIREGAFKSLYNKGYACPIADGIKSTPKVSGATVSTGGTLGRIGGAQIENMEGASFFAACLAAGLDFAEIRAVSNLTTDERSQWRLEEALSALGPAVARVIEELNISK